MQRTDSVTFHNARYYCKCATALDFDFRNNKVYDLIDGKRVSVQRLREVPTSSEACQPTDIAKTWIMSTRLFN